VARAEAAWRVREGQDGAPYAGPVPDGVAERWDTAAWTPVARSKRFAHLDGGIRDDPTFATVAALEDFDEATQTARKTPLFTVDVLTARPDRDTAATPAEAVAISMDETGQVDLDRVGSLLGVDADTAGTAVAGVVFTDPGQPGGSALVPAARYLSGNVRSKLAAAEAAAAATDPGFTVNVTALRQVMPRTIEAAEIAVRPGVPWIPTTDYEAFVRDVLGASTVSVDFTQGTWTVQVPSWQRNSPLMTDVFGTDDYDAAKLLEAVANSRPIQVLRPPRVVADTGADPVDPTKTFAAQAQARKLTERFAEWVFTDDTRRDRLVTEYNVRFNSLRPARYDGADLALPGQAGLDPHPHQRDAVARIINEPTVLLDHVVGAGKTGVMFMGAMELRRLGLARQPWIVVPNHLIEQVGREAKQWYPAANVLIAANTDNPERRRRFAAQTATSDWDMVIVPKSVFTAIGVSPQRRAEHLQREADALQAAYRESTNPIGTKKIQDAIAAQKKRLRALTEAPVKDTGLTFEEVGADYLLIDFSSRPHGVFHVRRSAVRALPPQPATRLRHRSRRHARPARGPRRGPAGVAGRGRGPVRDHRRRAGVHRPGGGGPGPAGRGPRRLPAGPQPRGQSGVPDRRDRRGRGASQPVADQRRAGHHPDRARPHHQPGGHRAAAARRHRDGAAAPGGEPGPRRRPAPRRPRPPLRPRHDPARRALETVTAQLRIDAAGPAAAARNAEAQQRMAAAGRQPGWSLELNPTPAMLEQLGVDPVTYRAELARRQYQHQPAVTGRGERDPAHAMAERGHPPAPHASGAARLIAQTQGRARDHTPQPAPPGPPPQLDGPGYGQHLDRGEDHGHEL